MVQEGKKEGRKSSKTTAEFVRISKNAILKIAAFGGKGEKEGGGKWVSKARWQHV